MIITVKRNDHRVHLTPFGVQLILRSVGSRHKGLEMLLNSLPKSHLCLPVADFFINKYFYPSLSQRLFLVGRPIFFFCFFGLFGHFLNFFHFNIFSFLIELCLRYKFLIIVGIIFGYLYRSSVGFKRVEVVGVLWEGLLWVVRKWWIFIILGRVYGLTVKRRVVRLWAVGGCECIDGLYICGRLSGCDCARGREEPPLTLVDFLGSIFAEGFWRFFIKIERDLRVIVLVL